MLAGIPHGAIGAIPLGLLVCPGAILGTQSYPPPVERNPGNTCTTRHTSRNMAPVHIAISAPAAREARGALPPRARAPTHTTATALGPSAVLYAERCRQRAGLRKWVFVRAYFTRYSHPLLAVCRGTEAINKASMGTSTEWMQPGAQLVCFGRQPFRAGGGRHAARRCA